MTSQNNEVPERYTSLPLASGNYPFQLAKNEKLTNYQWAWRFLRLNPLYRHDFELQKTRPAILRIPSHKTVAKHIGNPPPPEFAEIDSRRFCYRGEILSGKCTWPNYIRQSIDEYRQSHLDTFRYGEIKLREFDSAREYGIAHWFDPCLEELPPLGPGQSWFFPLVEPIWEVARKDIELHFDGIKTDFAKNKIYVGCTGEMQRSKFKTVLKRRTEHISAELTRTWLENVVDDADKTFPPSPSFSTSTEIVFLVDLDMYIQPQLDQVQHVAFSFQKLLQTEEGLSKKLSLPPIGFEPLMFHPGRALGQGFSQIRSAFEDLLSRSAKTKKNCRAVLFDVAYTLPFQMSLLTEALLTEQVRLRKAGLLPYTIRKKAGNDTGGDHWLKRALCLLELHLNKQGLTKGKLIHANQLAKMIYDERDHSYHAVRNLQKQVDNQPTGGGKNGHNNNLDESQRDSVRGALEVGKSLSEFQYSYLVGLPQKTT